MRAAELETVIFLRPSAGGGDATTRKVGGVPVLLRLFRVLTRAGVRQVRVVTPEPSHQIRRWGRSVKLEVVQPPVWSAEDDMEALLIEADLAFQDNFLKELLEQRKPSRWIEFSPGADGPAGILVGPGLKGEFADLESVRTAVAMRSTETDRISALNGHPCVRISDRAAAVRFHRLIERTMTKDTDAMFARWNRKVSIPLTRVLARLPISPNMMTYITLLVAGVGAWYLSRGGYWEMLLGGLLTQLSSILDGNDGELARLKVMDSDYGTWLDTLCDYVSYFFTFGGVTWGLYNRSGDGYYLWLGGMLLLGIGLGMIVTSYFRKRHTGKGRANELTRIVIERLEEKRSDLFSYVTARLRHFATRATFSYFVLLFGLLNWWEVLLWFAVVGAWVYVVSSIYHARHLGQARSPSR